MSPGSTCSELEWPRGDVEKLEDVKPNNSGRREGGMEIEDERQEWGELDQSERDGVFWQAR